MTDTKEGEIVKVVGEIKAYDSFRAELTEMQTKNATLVFDYESKQGQKEARSHIHLLRKSKAALEGARKEAKAEALAHGRKVDSEAKEIESVIVDMIDVHLAPVEEAEHREEKRMVDIATKIERFAELASPVNCNGTTYTVPELQEGMAQLVSIEIDVDDFAEFIDEAQCFKDKAITTLQALIDSAIKSEKDAAELEQLRQDAAERDEKDRKEREAKAQAARDEKLREDARAEERLASANREQDLKDQAAKAVQDKKDAEALAERNKQDAIRLTEERLKREAAEAEKERLAKEAKATAEAERKAANKRHQAKINNAAVKSLVENGLETEDAAKALVRRIAQGKITNVTINY